MNNPPLRNGYDVENKDSIDDKYKCPVCKFILREPVQLVCGHRLCQKCLPEENNVHCPVCLHIMPKSEVRLDNGFNREIQALLIICIFCEWSGPLKIYEIHLDQSHQQYICSKCNQTFSSLALLTKHADIACPLMAVDCIFKVYGCKQQILRCDLPKHYLTEEHQRIVLLFITPIISAMTKSDQKLPESDIHTEQEMIYPPHITNTSTTMSTIDECNIQTEAIKDVIDTFEGGINALKEEIQQMNSESSHQSQLVETTNQQVTAIKTSCEESNANIHAWHTNITILDQSFSTSKQIVEEKQIASYDGTFVWKITNVQKKIIDAQSERQISIYSPSFFSSPTGYKMCLRLYLFGDGNARRTHMSLFFVLMRSVNDPLLKFPFNYKISFCLFDQSGQQNHITDSFRPDIRSTSFQRPRSNMNIASGIPKFVSLDIIQQPNSPYVKDDTMFIKAMIDFLNLPKTMLPYAMNLNPGLPTNYQQRMIQEEIERRAQSQSQHVSQTDMINNEETRSIISSIGHQQDLNRDEIVKK